MKQGIQTFLSEAGEAACYALDIVKIAERVTGRDMDPIMSFYDAVAAGLIHYNEQDPNDNNNFFVTDPARLLSCLTGIPWTVEKADADYLAKSGEYVVDRWERRKTGAVIGHFRLPDWDSLADSQTVKYGSIVSKRVFRRA